MSTTAEPADPRQMGEEFDWQTWQRRRTATRRLRKRLQPPAIPRATVEDYRRNVPDLITRITNRIHEEVSGLAPADEHPDDEVAKAICGAVTQFIDVLVGVPSQRGDVFTYFRHLGELSGRSGRPLDAMRAAHGIATEESWSELRRAATTYDLSAEVQAQLTDALLQFQRELIAQAEAGHRAGHARARRPDGEGRRQFLDTLLDGSAPRDPEPTTWPNSGPVVVAVADPDSDQEADSVVDDDLGTFVSRRSEGLVVVASPEAMQALTARLAEQARTGVAVSWPVPPDEIRHAHRWAVGTLALAKQGVIDAPSSSVLRCEDHLDLLWIHADPALRRQTDETLLAPMMRIRPKHRIALAQTLLLWLQTRSSAPTLAAQLGIHEQTVRYRLRSIKKMFGDQLDDPSRIITLLAGIESALMHWTSTETTGPGTEP